MMAAYLRETQKVILWWRVERLTSENPEWTFLNDFYYPLLLYCIIYCWQLLF
jgi:hypothetical protein